MSDAIPKAIYFSGLHDILGTMSCSQEGKKCIIEIRFPSHTKMLSKVVANFLPVHNNTCQHWEQAVTCLFSLANFKSVESLNSSEHRWSHQTPAEKHQPTVFRIQKISRKWKKGRRLLGCRKAIQHSNVPARFGGWTGTGGNRTSSSKTNLIFHFLVAPFTSCRRHV